MTKHVPSACRSAFLAAMVLLLGACAHSAPRNPLATWVPSMNFDERRPVGIVPEAIFITSDVRPISHKVRALRKINL